MATTQAQNPTDQSRGSLLDPETTNIPHHAVEMLGRNTPQQAGLAVIHSNASGEHIKDNVASGSIKGDNVSHVAQEDVDAAAAKKTQKANREEVTEAAIKAKAEEGWKKCMQKMRDEDDKMVKDWNDEIDMLILFAGLFSAVVTTFVVQSYPALQRGDQSAQILLHISQQLSSLSVGVELTNSSAPFAASAFRARTSTVAINTLWFISLGLSLIVAIFCIFVRQWLRVYNDWQKFSPLQSVRLRQARFKELLHGQIPLIMNLLPLAVQIALALFLTGLVILLWDLNHIVAIFTSALSAFLAIAIAIVSVLPTIQPFSPFKSSLSWTLLQTSAVASKCWHEAALFLKAPHLWSPNRTGSNVVNPVPEDNHKEPVLYISWDHVDHKRLPQRRSPDDQTLEAGVLDWIHTYVIEVSAVNEVISACAWDIDLHVLMQKASACKGEDISGYGNALIQAIELKRYCRCSFSVPDPPSPTSSEQPHVPSSEQADCSHIGVQQLMDTIMNLAVKWMANQEDRQRYCEFLFRNYNLLSKAVPQIRLLQELYFAVEVLKMDVTHDLQKLERWLSLFQQIDASNVAVDEILISPLCDASEELLQLLSHISPEELVNQHRSALLRFWSQQKNISRALDGAEWWGYLSRWPNAILNLSSKHPSYFDEDFGNLLIQIKPPRLFAADEGDHKTLLKAGETIIKHFSKRTPSASSHHHLDSENSRLILNTTGPERDPGFVSESTGLDNDGGPASTALPWLDSVPSADELATTTIRVDPPSAADDIPPPTSNAENTAVGSLHGDAIEADVGFDRPSQTDGTGVFNAKDDSPPNTNRSIRDAEI